MNLCAFIGVLFRKESDCIIIDRPLNAIKKLMSEIESGLIVFDSIFAPFVISTMPDIILGANSVFIWHRAKSSLSG